MRSLRKSLQRYGFSKPSKRLQEPYQTPSKTTKKIIGSTLGFQERRTKIKQSVPLQKTSLRACPRL